MSSQVLSAGEEFSLDVISIVEGREAAEFINWK